MFPFDPRWTQETTLAKNGFIDSAPGFGGGRDPYYVVNAKAVFTTVVAVDFGPRGLLYALELSTDPGFQTPGASQVVRVKHSGAIEEVITGLAVPLSWISSKQ